jgi:hypothetical protein
LRIDERLLHDVVELVIIAEEAVHDARHVARVTQVDRRERRLVVGAQALEERRVVDGISEDRGSRGGHGYQVAFSRVVRLKICFVHEMRRFSACLPTRYGRARPDGPTLKTAGRAVG